MTRLPPYHVVRSRLTDRCLDADVSVVVVDAAAGYGKSVFAAELVEAWGAVPIPVLLEERRVSAQLLAGRLRTAVARAGFVETAGLMGHAREHPAGAVDAMVVALSGETSAIIIDDAHHLARDAGLLLDRIAGEIAAPLRLVVLARRMPPGTERLRRAGAVHFLADDLALSADETVELCRSGFGLSVTEEEGGQLRAATGGWTAATVLAASRAQHDVATLRSFLSLDDRARPAHLTSPVGEILHEVLTSLGAERDVLVRIAPLPLIGPELLADVTGDPEFFERAVALGLPITPTAGGWWELPGPVRDHLAALRPPDLPTLLAAARHYERHGELGLALEMLLGAEADEPAAQLLSEIDVRAAETVDPLELLAQFERIAKSIRDRYPWAAFQVARACGIGALLEPRAELLGWLKETVSAECDPVLRRAVDAELAVDLINVGQPHHAEAVGREVLEAAAPGEQFTRARALLAVGFGLCLRRDSEGRLSESSLREAARVFDQSTAIYRSINYREASQAVVVPRAIWTELGRGRPLAALAVLDAGLADCAGHALRVGRTLFHRAQVLGELGRFDEGESDLAEVERIGRRHGDGLLVACAYWVRMVYASLRGDAQETVRAAHEVEAHRGEWWSAVGGDFLAEAADSLDRVGHVGPAWELLGRAKAEPHVAERWIALAEGALLARHGDPALAEEQLAVVHRRGIFPKEYWRVTLLRAVAAWRRGDETAGPLAARAFEEAARLGQPQAPLIREREITESLLALAMETGSPDAVALDSTSLPTALSVLGRCELTRGGAPVPLGVGQSVQLLKLVAVSDGQLLAERAMEALWPEADPVAARNRLRTVLGRLREVARDVLERDGDLLVLSPGVRLDLAEFHREARQSLSLAVGDPLRAVALARSAISRYRGDLLPDDLYEDWAEAPRDRARRTALELLDLCATAAATRGDLDEARRFVERTIELAPYEDDRYLRVAAILEEQGRRGAALSVIRRARATLASLGVDLPTAPAGRPSFLADSTLPGAR